MTTDLLDDLFNAKPTIQSVEQQQISVWKPNAKKGAGQVYEAVIRFIPNPESPSDKSIVMKNTVFLQNPYTNAGMEIDCPSTVGKPDPIQDTFFSLRNSDNPVLKENSKKFSRRQRYSSLVQILTCKSEPSLVNKILVWSYGIKIHEKIYNEMNPPMGTPRNPFNMFTGRPFYVKVKLVSGFNNFDDSVFIDLPNPTEGYLRMVEKDALGKETIMTISPELINSSPDARTKVLNYLKENCPSLEPYEYHDWSPETTAFVNQCIQIYTNPGSSMQAATGGFGQQATNPYMSGPAMQPTVVSSGPVTPSVTPTSQAVPTMTTGLEMGSSAASLMQTTPGGFNAGNVPTMGGELDSLLGGAPQAAPSQTSNMSLDDVLAGVMA